MNIKDCVLISYSITVRLGCYDKVEFLKNKIKKGEVIHQTSFEVLELD